MPYDIAVFDEKAFDVGILGSVETLRPNAAGDSTQFTIGGSSPAPTNWQSVDEAVADDLVTYVLRYNVNARDLYNVADPTFEDSATINEVIVYWRCARVDSDYNQGYYGIKSGGTEYWSDLITFPSAWTDYHTHYVTDPKTGVAWTKANVAALQVGVKAITGEGMGCTQVYVEVDYTAVTTYELSLSDGLKLGDATISLRNLYLSLTDGLKSGDATSNIAKFFPSLTAGLKLGDTSVAGLTRFLSLIDGLKLGDTTITTLQLAYFLTLIDGLKLGDTTTSQRVLYLILTDGIKLGDTATAVRLFYLTLADGIKLGDTTLAQKIFNLLLTEGFKVGDILSYDILYTFLVGDKKIDEYTEKQLLEFGAKMASETGNKTIGEQILKFIQRYRS